MQRLNRGIRELYFRTGDALHLSWRKIRRFCMHRREIVTNPRQPEPYGWSTGRDKFREREAVGVNVAGYLESEKGVGEAARATLRSLQAADIPYTLNNIVDVGSCEIDKANLRSSREGAYPFNVIHINADLLPRFARTNPGFLRNRYNIGFWNWELSQFPKEWSDRFSYLHEVWVPSSFCLDAISRVSPIPVVRIPYSVDPTLKVGDQGIRAQMGIDPRAFIFLFYFDFHSYAQRKNPVGVIEAFRKSFRDNEDVVLLIKCSHAKKSGLGLLEDACHGSRNIKIYNAVVPRSVLITLLATCNAYVSLHRCEGFGLTLVEAMNVGKPVIATGYSGNTDFMSADDSFLVKYKLIEIKENSGPYKQGSIWAEPDLDHATELMRFVYSNQDYANAVGQLGQRRVRQLLHPTVIGGAIRKRLAEVAERGSVEI